MMKRILCVAATSVSFLAVNAQANENEKAPAANVADDTSNLRIIRNGDSAVLVWKMPTIMNNASGIRSFIIYRSEEPNFDLSNPDNVLAIVNSTETSFVDVNADRSTIYYYTISLIDQQHNEQLLAKGNSGKAYEQPQTRFTLSATAGDNQQVTLQWTVEQPETVSYFDIEKSINGRDFTVITKMGANRQHEYETSDIAGPAGTVYYRLKMVDKSSKPQYSNIETVRLLNTAKLVKVYPNILLRGDVLTVKNISENKVRIDYTLMNSSGKIAAKGTLLPISGPRSINETRSLTSGRYVLQVVQGNQHQVIQVMVQ